MRHLGLSMLLLLCIPFLAISQINPGLLGAWESLPLKSTDIDLYRSMGVELKASGKSLVVVNTWGRGRSYRDSIMLRTDGTVAKVPVTNRVFPSNAFMGLMMVEGTDREISASLEAGG